MLEGRAGIGGGGLQTHLVIQELASEDFEAHPRLSHILKIYLRDNAVSQSLMDRVLAETTKIKRIAKKAEKTADHALQKTMSVKASKD